ncbi:MAG: glutamine-hydrolyzing carbamoyl-phosphate synthase small subunit [Phycisphaerales bacterium]|nr:glutamine-hydrolyzing carbamoyl-phosphate synthase small subunit [Phycisphaerales bacterium]
MICKLALEDGCVFTGHAFGAPGTRVGEVVFNTAMTGYQEILTDPSYCGQIVVMTFPLIGNYGVNEADIESGSAHLSGMAVCELPQRPSNHRATASLAAYLERLGITGISGIDTRALTRRIRERGAVRGVLSTEAHSDVELVRMAADASSMVGANLVAQVSPKGDRGWSEPYEVARETAKSATGCHLVAIDCGIKYNILRHLADRGDRVTVVPASAGADHIRALAPRGIVVGNGPGDPEAVADTIRTIRELFGEFPMLGICLGHQMMALAAGAKTYKLKFGHHGGNVPVMNKPANRVEITSQNHGFAVDAATLADCGGQVTHVNLNDGSLEGFVLPDRQAAAIQFHPEASPGPHDAGYVLAGFVDCVRRGVEVSADTLLCGREAVVQPGSE